MLNKDLLTAMNASKSMFNNADDNLWAINKIQTQPFEIDPDNDKIALHIDSYKYNNMCLIGLVSQLSVLVWEQYRQSWNI